MRTLKEQLEPLQPKTAQKQKQKQQHQKMPVPPKMAKAHKQALFLCNIPIEEGLTTFQNYMALLQALETCEEYRIKYA